MPLFKTTLHVLLKSNTGNSSKSLLVIDYLEQYLLFFYRLHFCLFSESPPGDEEKAWQMSFLFMNLMPLGAVGVPKMRSHSCHSPPPPSVLAFLSVSVGLNVQVHSHTLLCLSEAVPACTW